jgi:predicted protein tyrosine phosphatase
MLIGNFPTMSSGINNDAEVQVTPELIAWADRIFAMGQSHRSKLSSRFSSILGRTRIVGLDIPEDCDFMDPALVHLLPARVP